MLDKQSILDYFTRLDAEITKPATLYLYGSAVVILLDAPGRTSLDIDVAGPYSSGDMAEIATASERAGLMVNPDVDMDSAHLEWVGPLRLCLPQPTERSDGMLLWSGSKLTIKTGSVPELVASKLIRYDEIDKADIQFLYSQTRFDIKDVEEAVGRLPMPFNRDVLVHDNLAVLGQDLATWEKQSQ